MRLCKFIFAAVLAVMPMLGACDREPAPQGTVASVNGEHINLHSVQALMDSRSASLGIPSGPSVAEMQKRYGNALGILIVHTLVRQELARLGMAVTENELDKAIGQIKSDYAGGSLENFLAEAYLREDEWRQLMRDYLSLDIFTKRILLPSIHIRLEELTSYYNRHADDFNMPETWRVCLKAAETKAKLEAWCAGLRLDMPGGAGLQCVTVEEKEIPLPWQRDIKKIKPAACGKIIEDEGQWRVAAVISKNGAGKRKLSDIYAVIENILLDEKKNAAFDQWLTQKLKNADIRVAPDIISRESSTGK